MMGHGWMCGGVLLQTHFIDTFFPVSKRQTGSIGVLVFKTNLYFAAFLIPTILLTYTYRFLGCLNTLEQILIYLRISING